MDTAHFIFKIKSRKELSIFLGISLQNLPEDSLNYFYITLQCIIIKYAWLFYYLSALSQLWSIYLFLL